MQPQIRTCIASDGYKLHYRHWTPPGAEVNASILALHGIQSHSGWFTYSSRRLCEAGFEVSFLDRRGSGMNEPARGHAASDGQLVDDVVQMLTSIREQSAGIAPGKPVILLGVSWGGKLAAVTAAQRPDLVDRLALLYPGLRARVRPRWDQNLMLTLAGWLGIRNRRIRIPLDNPALFTSDPGWQDFIRSDPLALHEVSTSFLLANRGLDKALESVPDAVRCPVLALLAGDDQIVDSRATREFVSRFASTDAVVSEYPGARHTLEFEPVREEAVGELIRWLNCAAPPPQEIAN